MATVPRAQLCEGGPTLSAVALGCMRFDSFTPEQCLEVIKGALDLGITTLDNADIYGSFASPVDHAHKCESIVGQALALEPGLRSRVEIITKSSVVFPVGTSPQLYDSSPDAIRTQVAASLQALQVDYVDVFLLHRPDYLQNYDETAKVLAELTAGDSPKVRHVGVSNYMPPQFRALQAALDRISGPKLCTNQVEVSCAATQHLNDGVLDLCQEFRFRPMVWGPLAGFRNGALWGTGGDQQSDRLHAALAEVGADLGLPRDQGVAMAAYAWVGALPARPVIVTGTTKVDRLAQAARAASLRLSGPQWYKLLEASVGERVP